ncbi:MAG: 3-oxoacyl-ACP synthase [Sphingomonadaceae bacterium]|nr:3-oxoacyl-ACP synthase [Sphingomonadaceae bacterium]
MLATPRLDDAAREGLAELVPLLGCGEEAASLAFDRIAAVADDALATAALDTIAREEEGHEVLICALAQALGPVPPSAAVRRAKRMHISFGRGSPALHLARITALDSGLCLVLGRLLAPGRPLAADPISGGVLTRIRRDETRHVRLSRRLAAERAAGAPLLAVAAEARAVFADVLSLGGAALERLDTDPDRLFADLRAVPRGLFA